MAELPACLSVSSFNQRPINQINKPGNVCYSCGIVFSFCERNTIAIGDESVSVRVDANESVAFSDKFQTLIFRSFISGAEVLHRNIDGTQLANPIAYGFAIIL